MSKGENVPASVGYFSYQIKSTKGKNHPEGVSTGPDGVKTYNKTKSTVAPAGGAARSTVPPGVVRGDGIETRKGITVKHLNAVNAFTKGGSTSATPGGVTKHSGLSAPKSVK